MIYLKTRSWHQSARSIQRWFEEFKFSNDLNIAKSLSVLSKKKKWPHFPTWFLKILVIKISQLSKVKVNLEKPSSENSKQTSWKVNSRTGKSEDKSVRLFKWLNIKLFLKPSYILSNRLWFIQQKWEKPVAIDRSLGERPTYLCFLSRKGFFCEITVAQNLSHF